MNPDQTLRLECLKLATVAALVVLVKSSGHDGAGSGFPNIKE